MTGAGYKPLDYAELLSNCSAVPSYNESATPSCGNDRRLNSIPSCSSIFSSSMQDLENGQPHCYPWLAYPWEELVEVNRHWNSYDTPPAVYMVVDPPLTLSPADALGPHPSVDPPTTARATPAGRVSPSLAPVTSSLIIPGPAQTSSVNH